MPTVAVDVTDWASKARLRCPEGHVAWRARERTFYCRTCYDNGLEPTYRSLVDAKTGRVVGRGAVRIRGR